MMVKRPSSRVAMVVFDGEVLVDCMPFQGTFCQVEPFDTSLVLGGFDIYMAPTHPENPIDVVVIVDNRPETQNVMSVLKGMSGDIERYSVKYDKGIRGIFFIRNQPGERHPVFAQNWRIQYTLSKRRVFIRSDKQFGITTGSY